MRKVGQLAALSSTGNNTHASVPTDEREGLIQIQFRITAVGATPTITFKVQGSYDPPATPDASSDWADLELDPLDNTAANTSFTKTAVGATDLAVPVQDQPTKIRLVTSANTNVTYDAEVYQ